MTAAGKFTQDRRMTIGAHLVPDEGRAGNLEWGQNGGAGGGTGTQHKNKGRKRDEQKEETDVMHIQTASPGHELWERSRFKHDFGLDSFSSRARAPANSGYCPGTRLPLNDPDLRTPLSRWRVFFRALTRDQTLFSFLLN